MTISTYSYFQVASVIGLHFERYVPSIAVCFLLLKFIFPRRLARFDSCKVMCTGSNFDIGYHPSPWYKVCSRKYFVALMKTINLKPKTIKTFLGRGTGCSLCLMDKYTAHRTFSPCRNFLFQQ